MLAADIPRMSVIPLTVFLSLLLVACFLVLFIREQRRQHFAGAERDSLLPLAEETPRLAGHAPGPDTGGHEGDEACGCRDGSRPPCAGCRRQTAASPATADRSS